MDSDLPLKLAFRVRPRDLLPLVDHADARVVSAGSYELPAGKRTVDIVLRLRRGGEEYLRHLEFQTQHRADLAARCFEYASRLASASRLIRREAPEPQQPDLLAILQVFAEGRYTARQLSRVIPEEVVMASGLFEKAIAKGRVEGRAEGLAEGQAVGLASGRTEATRQLCVELVRTLHPAVAPRVVPAIEACSELTRLRRWALRAPRVSDAELTRLVIGPSGGRTTRRRAPRPLRNASR